MKSHFLKIKEKFYKNIKDSKKSSKNSSLQAKNFTTFRLLYNNIIFNLIIYLKIIIWIN